MGIYDIGIIGGGTAGMTAAIYGQRAGKQTVLFEGTTIGGQITSSPNVENYPGIASVSGSEFSMNLMDQAVKLGTQTIMEQVTGIREEADYKVIVTTEKEYECKSIILATGVTHRHLGVPGEERLTGAGVSYCATCDGMFFRGREVAVVGGGSTALQDAEFLSNYCSKVYLIHRRDEFRGEDQIVKRLQSEFPQLHMIERKGKLGLGTAYITGFKWSLEHGYNYIFEMDADFSHNPDDLVKLYHACESGEGDMAIGSRYVTGVNVVNWPMGRVLMSYFASKYVRFITGMKVHDATAGFVCYTRKVLESIDLDNIRFKGYAFQIEMKFTAWTLGFKLKEVPIIFTDRTLGTSKMSGGIFNEAFWGVITMKLRSLGKRKAIKN